LKYALSTQKMFDQRDVRMLHKTEKRHSFWLAGQWAWNI